MKTAGIIGGVGPESTMDYYRTIIARYRERNPDGSYPLLIITSIDLKQMVDLVTADRLAEVADLLVAEFRRLEQAGADFGLIAANTPHVVFDVVRQRSPLRLISIVEVTAEAARSSKLQRVGLLGTRFTMQGRFYHDVFARVGIPLFTPDPEEQDEVHGIYMNELVLGILRPESQARLLTLVERMAALDGIDGLILGGTELPLLLRQPEHRGVQFLDTTRLHVEQVVTEILS